jgi:hypothetical protein
MLFVDPRIEKSGYLTDAPFLYKTRGGDLLLLWSSYSIPVYSESGLGGYTVYRPFLERQDSRHMDT